jgi:hypothetical protein
MIVDVNVSDIFNACIKVIRVTPEGKVAAIDYVIVTTLQDKKCARETISNLEKNNFFTNLEKYQFPGPGQRSIYVLNAKEAIQLLLMIFPDDMVQAFRMESAALLTRLFSGDPTLHDLLRKSGLITNTMYVFLGHLILPIPTTSCVQHV